MEALQVQLEEQTHLAKDQIEMLLEDRRVKAEEAETRRLRDQEQIKLLTDRWVAFGFFLNASVVTFVQPP